MLMLVLMLMLGDVMAKRALPLRNKRPANTWLPEMNSTVEMHIFPPA